MMDSEERLDERKPYIKPEIVHELALETRAGSPIDSPWDPFEVSN